MSKPKYLWWDYVRKVIRNYPKRCEEYNALHEAAVTKHVTSYKDANGELCDCYSTSSGGNGRTVENVSLRELPRQNQKEYDAVRLAVECVRLWPNGEIVLKIIDLYHWHCTHTLAGAGMAVGYSEDQTKKLHGKFVRLVAQNLEFL